MLMTKIKTLKNWNEDHTKREPIAPRTHIKAVFDDDGNTLDSLMAVQDEKLAELGSKVEDSILQKYNANINSGTIGASHTIIRRIFSVGEKLRVKVTTDSITKCRIVGRNSNTGETVLMLNGNSFFTDYEYIVIERDDLNEIRLGYETSSIIFDGTIGYDIVIFNGGTVEQVMKLEEEKASKEEVDEIKESVASLNSSVDNLSNKIYEEPSVLSDKSMAITVGSSARLDLYQQDKVYYPIGNYTVIITPTEGSISSFRMVGYREDKSSVTLLNHTQPIGEEVSFTTNEVLTYLRVVIDSNNVLESGSVNGKIYSSGYDIQKDIEELKESTERNTSDIQQLKENTNTVVSDFLFPVPTDIYCAVGTDMNLYYENMFGMILGSGYMFVDSPNVVYDTSADESGGYDRPLNLDRQFHFKPNAEGIMELYLNVWDCCMKQVAAKQTTLHIVDRSAISGKTINMLVNGSSSIDMGFFQAEIKNLLESSGATVNMVGRWASGNADDSRGENYNVSNRLSENRSGGASNLYTTKANSGKTVIVHPTNLSNSFFNYSSVLQDDAGNKWDVWANSNSFCELVLKSGSVSAIPSSGILTKVSGSGPNSISYDRLITNVPQTTNPFWSDNLNGISFTEYCSNWNRPAPNVFVTLWGTNDIGGSGGNIETGKQWATDAQIKTFVDRQKILVDAYTRDCPNGVVIMCPQPTGSTLTGKKNSDKNGMLYSKLKATQALMDAFAEYDNVIIVPVLWWFDRKYSYVIKEVTMSERMADYYKDKTLDIVTDDSTHPQARGYCQMADAAFSAIVYAAKELM